MGKNSMPIVFIMAIILLIAVSGCNATDPTPVPTMVPLATMAATPTPAVSDIQALQTQVAQLTELVTSPTERAPRATSTPRATATPVADAPEPAPLEPTAAPPVTNWTQMQVALYAEGVQTDDLFWELPLGTWFAVSTANERYEAVESAPVGVVGNTDHGWCADDQIDCPPHALLVRVEVPVDKVACFTARMDISWRIQVMNACGTPVPMRVAIRYNDVTRTAAELATDYLALAGLTQRVQNATSEVGLFVSVKETGMSELHYLNEVVPFGYSCWDCLADTQGVDGQPVLLVPENFSTFGPDTTPQGSTMRPGVVFPLPRPADEAYQLEFELNATTNLVVWVGRYDLRPLSANPTTP